jgi:hypothetical protein
MTTADDMSTTRKATHYKGSPPRNQENGCNAEVRIYEHTFRFVKSTLGWTTPALQTPDQADRWTWMVVAVYTQLRLARGLVDDQRLPWERPRDPAKLTPARVRRGFQRLRSTLGTPATAPKSDRPGPGRPKNTRRPPRTRYPAVKKAA